MPKLRVLLADDHPVVREGLRTLIDAQADMEVVGEEADGRAALRRALEVRPDLVVMDISMPGLGGAQATEELRRSCPEVRVLTLTVHEDSGYLRRLLEAGASGYVLKRAAPDELVHAIRVVAGGNLYLDPRLAEKLVGGLIRGAPPGRAASGEELSEREAEVVRLIASGYSNKEIAGRLGISVKTVETYKARSMDKLGLHNRSELVRYAHRRGWLDGE